jgi:hypothetical protein
MADVSSESAEGWVSGALTAMEHGRDLPPGFGPGNRLHFAGIQFLDPTRDLLAPGFFCGGVHGLVQTLKQ